METTIQAQGRDSGGAGGNGVLAMEAGRAGGPGAVWVGVNTISDPGWGQLVPKHKRVSV